MFGIVHVLLPVSDRSPAEAIRASLAPFQRGGRGDVPHGWLTFHDETGHVRALHAASWVFTDEGRGGLRTEGGGTIGTWASRPSGPRWRVEGCGAGPCGSPRPSPTSRPSSTATSRGWSATRPRAGAGAG